MDYPPTLHQRPDPRSVLVPNSAYSVFAVGAGLFAEYPPPTSSTTEASYAGLIRLILIPVMIARHIFLMTGGYQSVLKHATSQARSPSVSVTVGEGGGQLIEC